jgi:F-type H+-transporting ATPase subunit delta
VSDPKLLVTGLAGRYASALFDLANEAKSLDQVSVSVDKMVKALTESQDVQALVSSPVVSREQAGRAIASVAAALGLDDLTTRFLGVLAANRRLAALPQIIRGFGALLAAHKGETTADVTSAHALNDAQLAALKAKLRAGLGRDVTLTTRVDPAILGGLVVKVGSKLIDSSLKTKLDSLSLAMTKSA